MNKETFQSHKLSSYTSTDDLVKSALVIGLYVALTLVFLPLSFGPLQFRISEILNFLGLYHPRYKFSITLGVFIANFAQYGPIDMVVGSFTTLISFYMAIWFAERVISFKKRYTQFTYDPMFIKYICLIFFFAANSYTIAWMISILTVNAAFWPIYMSLFMSEGAVMTLGAFVFYPISQRINFYR